MSKSLSALSRALQGRSPQDLRPAWTALQDPVDLLIVGGGIHGAGIAREASHRGMRVAVVEQQDWGGGTSSRSSKLFHGGLRYLAQGEISLVRASLGERNLHAEQVPHLVRPLRFQVTLPGRPLWTRLKFRIGVALYDALTLGSSRAKPWGVVPSYLDAVTNDARFVWELIRDARDHGATALNYCRWESWDVDASGKIRGAKVRDQLTQQEIHVRARVCVNAAGPWAQDLESGGDLRLTRGTHLVLQGQPEDREARVFLSPMDDRVMFVIPYLDGCSLLGTTDLDVPAPEISPVPTPQEIAYLSEAFRTVFPEWSQWKPVGWQCGLRPLVREEGDPSHISREELIMENPDTGLWSVMGGKLTGYRAVAERVVNGVSGTSQGPPTGISGLAPEGAVPGGEPVYRAFAQEDAVLLEDLFYRRTFWGHGGGISPERLQQAAEHFGRRWKLEPEAIQACLEAFQFQLRNHQRVLALWP